MLDNLPPVLQATTFEQLNVYQSNPSVSRWYRLEVQECVWKSKYPTFT